jgi:hypothetical protein
MPKRAARAKHIVAQSITLKDSRGKTRIYMDSSSAPGFATICLFGDDGRAIELSANPDGGLHISIHDGTGKVTAGLAIQSDDRVTLHLYNHRSGTRTELGSGSSDGSHSLTIYHHGKLAWTTMKRQRRRGAG